MRAADGHNDWNTPNYFDETVGSKGSILSPRQYRSLLDGANVLIDEVFEDYANIYKGRSAGATMIIADCLPRQFRHRYTEPFIKQFIVCAVAVSGRLKHWSGEEIAHSTGECLALYAIIEKATSSLILADKETGKTIEEDPYLDFKNFERLAFVDGDYTSLFDPSLENIEDDEMADFKGMSLRLKDWFIPIYEDPAHPYLSGAGLPDGEEDSEEDLD